MSRVDVARHALTLLELGGPLPDWLRQILAPDRDNARAVLAAIVDNLSEAEWVECCMEARYADTWDYVDHLCRPLNATLTAWLNGNPTERVERVDQAMLVDDGLHLREALIEARCCEAAEAYATIAAVLDGDAS